MNNGRLTFVVPTYRLREVGETVAQYDEHFFRNGHSVDMIVFDDSSPSVQQKYFAHARADAHATTTSTTSARARRRPSSPT